MTALIKKRGPTPFQNYQLPPFRRIRPIEPIQKRTVYLGRPHSITGYKTIKV